MTTSVEAEFTRDATVKNDVCNLDRHMLAEGAKVAGASWFVHGVDASAYQTLLGRAIHALEATRGGSHVWLLVGNGAWQSNTKVSRHKFEKGGGFWGSLEQRGAELNGLSNFEEAEQTRGSEFRTFGAARTSPTSVGALCSVLDVMSSTYLVTSTDGEGIQSILESGWENEQWFDYSLVNKVVSADELLCKPMGRVRDYEAGLVCVGTPDRFAAGLSKTVPPSL